MLAAPQLASGRTNRQNQHGGGGACGDASSSTASIRQNQHGGHVEMLAAPQLASGRTNTGGKWRC